MTQSQFVTFMMGRRLNLAEIAITKFQLQNHQAKLQDASPSDATTSMKSSFMRLRVAAEENLQKDEKKKLAFRIGRDRSKQQAKYESLKDSTYNYY